MKIESWHSIEHWNNHLALKLNPEMCDALASFCKAVSQDRRFHHTGGFAEVWQRGSRDEVFSGELIKAVSTAVRETPDKLKHFLPATREVKEINPYGLCGERSDCYIFDDPTTVVEKNQWLKRLAIGGRLGETAFPMLEDFELNEKQWDYARDLYNALRCHLGYVLSWDDGDGFLVTIASIARRRIAKGRAPLPKGKK